MCGLIGIMDVSGERFSGRDIVTGITNMEERGNGLGAGFAVYGCYHEYGDCCAFPVIFTRPGSRSQVEAFLREHFVLSHAEEVPHRPVADLSNPPLIWRYFLQLPDVGRVCNPPQILGEAEYVVDKVMQINTAGQGAYIYASGKDVGVFKGVGHPGQIAEYFGVEEYTGYLWTAHARFPTNTPGWWGGAHPFGLLDWTVVHNGEISSYGINRRYLEQFGYQCTMQTDTEVIAYAIDLLVRQHKLPLEVAAKVLAPPFWDDIERMTPGEQRLIKEIGQVYGSILLNGPFAVIIARTGEMIGLTDRIRLRPLTVGEKGDMLYLSSEESAIRLVCPDLDKAWIPTGGQPVIGRLKTEAEPRVESAGEKAAVG